MFDEHFLVFPQWWFCLASKMNKLSFNTQEDSKYLTNLSAMEEEISQLTVLIINGYKDSSD